MFFSFILTLIVLPFFLCSCAKENLRRAQPVKVELKGNCDSLANIGTHLSNFAKGELSNQEISNVWSCTGRAVKDFDRITGGDLPGGDYSPQAVRHFFEVYFLSKRPVSDSLLASIMEIKRVLVAGSAQRITRAELARLQQLVEILREASVGINPYAKVAFLGGTEASDEEILSANQAFEVSFVRLGQWLTRQNQDYSFAQARSLIAELKKWMINGGKDAGSFEDFEKAFEIVPALKQLLLSGNPDGLKGSDWLGLSRAIGRAHCTLLALKFSFKDNLIAGLNRGAIPYGVGRFVEVLESAREVHPNKEIPLTEFSEFFAKLEGTGWLSKDITQASLDNAFSWAVNRLLSGAAGRNQITLNEEHIRVLNKQLKIWMDLREHVLVAGSEAPLAKKFDEVLNASVPAEWDKEGRMVFGASHPASWSLNSKLNMLWPFVVINWIKESFVGEAPDSMNETEMLGAGKEILPVLQKFNWLKTTKDTIGTKLLREADVFTMGSNGNLVLDLNEATRYLAFVASSFRAAQVWIEQTKNICPDKEAVCMRKAAADLSLDILTPLPLLQKSILRDPVKLFSIYSKAAEETIIGNPVRGVFGTGDLLQTWMIFQYVETFDSHFDADQNGLVDLPEGEEAFKLFGRMLEKLLTKKGFPTSEVPAFFTFLLKFGDTMFTMFGGGVAYNWWILHPNDWALVADRQKLVDVLKQLSKL